MYRIKYSKKLLKDKEKLSKTDLYEKAKNLIKIIKHNPFQTPPSYEKLIGDLSGLYSRRINRKHRIWYSVDKTNKIVYILRMWTHYDK